MLIHHCIYPHWTHWTYLHTFTDKNTHILLYLRLTEIIDSASEAALNGTDTNTSIISPIIINSSRLAPLCSPAKIIHMSIIINVIQICI